MTNTVNGILRTNLKRALLAIVVLSTLAGRASADVQIQTHGPQQFPGKFQVGFHPLGFQVGFDNPNISGYKLAADFSGLVKEFDKVSLWVGGALNFGAGTFSCYYHSRAGAIVDVRDCGYDLQFGAFVMLTMEKLIQIPLVPFVRAGVAGDVLWYDARATQGALAFRIGAGVHYYILKNVGLGAETNFTFGPGFNPLFFFGNWDFDLGARFAF